MSEVQQHHTDEQVALAFAYAPVILRQLVATGIFTPRFELFVDASGTLLLGDEGDISIAQYDMACDFVKSKRQTYRIKSKTIGIDFCCGLVIAAEEARNTVK